MAKTYDIALLIGSLRKDSLTRKLAAALVSLAPGTLNFHEVPLGDLPLYNADLDEGDVPDAWTRFRAALRPVDGVMFVTPEYNRSIPATIKNALDVGSRPYGESIWDGKPAAVVTGSPGGIGGFGANLHLRQSLVFLNMPAMQQPETYIGGIGAMFDDDGKVMSEDTRKFLSRIVGSFADLVALRAGAKS
ncbi:MAG: NAD(P)H-dependent oxidoreductase [Paracoccus sp. (in: a-proteobacteria)]|nr:NAD(P)H-dependent oxidoreductase [Paracoccus sp. (in: a-proteobacteria)]